MSVAVALHLAPPPTDLQFDGDARKRKTYSKRWKRINDMDMSASELEEEEKEEEQFIQNRTRVGRDA
jgi:hypothetical protein